MPVTPSGQVAYPLAKLAALLAASTTFVNEVTSASAHTHYPEADDTSDSTDTRPRAIIQFGPSRSAKKVGNNVWEKRGQLVLSFEFLPGSGLTTYADQLLDFANKTGAIMAEMEELAGDFPVSGESYLNMVGWEEIEGPGRCDPQHENDVLFYGHTFLVEYIA